VLHGPPICPQAAATQVCVPRSQLAPLQQLASAQLAPTAAQPPPVPPVLAALPVVPPLLEPVPLVPELPWLPPLPPLVPEVPAPAELALPQAVVQPVPPELAAEVVPPLVVPPAELDPASGEEGGPEQARSAEASAATAGRSRTAFTPSAGLPVPSRGASPLRPRR
jgi:hypothetical protein